MVGRRLVGRCSQRKPTEATCEVSEVLPDSISCKVRLGHPQACKPLSVSCPAMASSEGICGGLDEFKNSDTEPGDSICAVVEPVPEQQQLGEKLGRLSIQSSKEEAQEQKLDGSCIQTNRSNDELQSCSSECARKESGNSAGKDARIMEQRAQPKPSSKKRFFDRAKESRPPSLALLYQVPEEELCRSFQGPVDGQFSRHGQLHPPEDHQLIRNGYCLPTSLVSSPHSTESRNLDPNAREFTPCFSCSASPGIHPHQAMHVAPFGYPFSVPPEMAQVSYSADGSGAGFHIPPYANGGPVCYSAVPNTWDGSPVGVGIPAGSNLQGCRPNAPPMVVGPQSAHVGLLPMALSHPSQSPGQFCCIPGIDSLNVPDSSPSFSGPPPPIWKEHISRSLLLTGVAVYLSESQLRMDLECWGPVRALELERQQEGILIVHYYDLRHARDSLKDIQNQHLLKQQQIQHQLQSQTSPNANYYASDFQGEGKKCSESKCCDSGLTVGKRGLIGGNVVWAQYTSSLTAAVPDAHNLGTLVVFNVDADVSIDDLRAVFQKYGEVKELRETPSKRQHKFVEFYDVRDAATAWSALNGHEICGKAVKIEFSRPGGQARRARTQAHTETSGVGMQLGACNVSASVRVHNHPATPLQRFAWNGEPCTGSQHLSGSPTGIPTPFIWSNYSVGNGPPVAHQQWQRFPQGQPHPMVYPGTLCVAQNPNGPVMTGTPGSLLNRSSGATPEFIPGSGSPKSNGHGTGGRFAAFNNGSRNGEVPAVRRRRSGFCNGNGTYLKMDISNLPDADVDGRLALESGVVPRESTLSGRTGLTPRNSPREAHAQYMFDEREVHLNLASPRTTIMIRNIPNKYSQQMLLSLLDQHCLRCNSHVPDSEPQSAYDFVYLPIDFKNRCNLGYAFVNFTTALATLKFYKAFHEQAWEAFNSRKICQIAYARVQGRAALEEHFRNSRFACDTDEYLPLVFIPARSGIECPPPRVAAGQLNGKIPGVRVDSCRSPSRNGYLPDQGDPGCSPQIEKGSFDGVGLGIATITNVAVEGVGA